MTAPNYTDKDVVLGVTRDKIKELITGEATMESSLGQIILNLWDVRDKAREVAALQDKAIHKSASWVWVLEKLWMVVLQAKETGSMPKFVVIERALADIEVEKAKRDGSNKQGEEK